MRSLDLIWPIRLQLTRGRRRGREKERLEKEKWFGLDS